MATFTKAESNYIEHEVQLRLNDHKHQLFEQSLKSVDQKLDASFKHLDSKLDAGLKHFDNKLDASLKHLDNKLGWMLGIFVSTGLAACLIPLAFHFMKIG